MASSYSGSDTPCLKRRKGVVNADQYARNKYRDARVRGVSFVNPGGVKIPARTPASDCG